MKTAASSPFSAKTNSRPPALEHAFKAQIVPIIDALAEQGLVRREVDPVDRRRRVLDLTAKGRRVVVISASVGAEIERDLLSPLTPAEQATLRRMLLALLGAARESG